MILHEDRLFPAEKRTRAVARRLYSHIRDLPIVSPHGHTQVSWFAKNLPFSDAASLFVTPDHYIFRMLYSQGISLDDVEASAVKAVNPREVWRIFAKHYDLFRGTPTRMWLDFSFQEIFGLRERLSARTADHYFDVIEEALKAPEFLPRALYEHFNIEVLATTDSPVDMLEEHKEVRTSGWAGRIVPTFRADSVIDPDFPDFTSSLGMLGTQTGEDTTKWAGYLDALRKARWRFRSMGCTATDHGHPSAQTADLSKTEASSLFSRILAGATPGDRELFRGQMLTEMARMSLEDGLVMQIHAGCERSHNRFVHDRYGRDMGGDIPRPATYVDALRPLLDRFGNETELTIILFTLDESTYSRELAPLAGHYPCLRLGPPWWFHDSPEGMMRFREQVTETAGFFNTVGFNDDTRAFLSIPARHDMARRIDSSFLAKLVVEHRIDEDEAFELATDLTVTLVRKAYRLDEREWAIN